MKKKRKWIKWVILLAVVLVIAAGIGSMSKKTKSAAYTEIPVTQGSIETYYNFDGLVKPRRTQTITSAVQGRVRTVYVQKNQQVKKGDRLYKLEGGETIEADIDGEVTALYAEEGGMLEAGEVAAEIVDLNSLEVQLDVDEYDVAAVTPGEAVEITILAMDKKLDGEIVSINKNGVSSGDLSYYKAAVALEAGSGAYPGMQVSGRILRERAEDAVLLSQEAIQFDAYNRPFVYVREEGKEEPAEVPVEVGMTDGITCEILSGLQAGQTVLKPSGMSMEELMMKMREKNMGM